MVRLDRDEKILVLLACLLSFVMALLCYAGYQARDPHDRPWNAYAAGWTAFWLAVTVGLAFGALAMIEWNQKNRRE